LLFAADRIEHMQTELKPALDEGKIVICDRYTYSSLAYQGSAGLSLDWIKTINARGIQPDIGFFIDVPPQQISERTKKDMSAIPKWLEIRGLFLKFVKTGELMLIDGNQRKNKVTENIICLLSGLLKNHPDISVSNSA
jgi:dTMP kinase